LFSRKSLFVVLAVFFALGAAAPSFAGKVTPQISLDRVASGAQIAQSSPSLGSWVTFTTVIPSNVNNPRVEVLCYQNGALVYGEGGSPTDAFLLGGGGSIWLSSGGSASCIANLYYFTWKGGQPATVYLAATRFDAS
jgi:hypothetical protein